MSTKGICGFSKLLKNPNLICIYIGDAESERGEKKRNQKLCISVKVGFTICFI